MNEQRISAQRAADGQWHAVFWRASLALRPHLVGPLIGWSESTTDVVWRRELPAPFVPVILSFGAPFRISGQDHTSFLAGMHRGPSLVGSVNRIECVQFNLTHDAAYRLLSQSMHDLADRIVPVQDVLRRDAAMLIEQLGNTQCWAKRFEALEQFLLPAIEHAAGLKADVCLALARLEQSHGAASIGALKFETGLSSKRLTQAFKDQIGLPPKTMARQLRFQHAVRHLSSSAPDLAQIALNAGYYDQAHFNRDFREFSGITPTDYIRERRAGILNLPH